MLKNKLQKCCKNPYTLVFVDLNMPLMGGIEVIYILSLICYKDDEWDWVTSK